MVGIKSCDKDVTIVLATNRIAALIRIFFRNPWRYLHFGCLYSVEQSFTKIYERNFEISWNFYKKGIIMHELKKWSVAWGQRAGKKCSHFFVPTPKSKRLKQVTVNSDLHVGPSSLLLSWKIVHFYHVESKALACQEEALYWGVWLKKVTPHLSRVKCATPLNWEGIKRLLAAQ